MFCCWTKRSEDQIVRSRPSSSKIQSVECKHFTYKELEDATNKFHDNKLLGCGGFGSIYQGRLEDGSYVAVKQLDKGSDQDDTEFWKEVLIIGSIRHPNLVTLRGYCREAGRNERLIVYDYMPNGSVLDALLSSDDSLLPWSRRYSIALGSACGLEHLHEHCSARIIHRDIKPSNILLDRHFNAKVGDFGLAKLGLPDLTEVTTAVGGAQVFVDPEYAMTGKLTDKSDVFSFGMLLLVLISGRHNMETQASLNATGKVWGICMIKLENLDSEDCIILSWSQAPLNATADVPCLKDWCDQVCRFWFWSLMISWSQASSLLFRRVNSRGRMSELFRKTYVRNIHTTGQTLFFCPFPRWNTGKIMFTRANDSASRDHKRAVSRYFKIKRDVWPWTESQ